MNFTTCLRGRVKLMTDKQVAFIYSFIKKEMIKRGIDNG